MSDSPPSGIIWAHCNQCCQKTRHSTVAQHQERQEHDGAGVWWLDEYKIIKCAGCDDVHFIRRNIFSEDAYGEEDDFDWKIAEYPPRIDRQLPQWIAEIQPGLPAHLLEDDEKQYVDETLTNILLESYAALHNGSRMLVVMGARAALERLMMLKIEDQGSFPKNVDEFVKQGYLQPKLRQPLLDAIDAGSAAIHRGYAPPEGVLANVFDILEGIINSTLILPGRAAEVQKATPPRPKKKPPKEDPA